MKKHISIIILSISIIILLSGCQKTDNQSQNQPEEKSYELTLTALQDSLNEQRMQSLKEPLVHTIDDYGIIEQNDKADFTPEEVEKYSTWVHFQNKITAAEAMEDVDELMRLLKTSYAGYNYFGGDEKFGEARARIEKRVNETYNEEMSISYPFYLIVKEELAFIEDSRFRIGRSDSYFTKQNIYFDTEKRDFLEDGNGFYTMLDNTKWYLSDEDVQNLHVTISDEGTLVYGLFLMTDDEKTLPTSISLKTLDGKQYIANTTWALTNVGPRATDSKVIHTSYETDGINVTSLNQMSLEFHDLSATNDFINEAKELKNEKTFILDLRNNSGEINEVADFFLYNLTGEKCDGKTQFATRYSEINKNIEKAIDEKKELSDFSSLDFYNENREMVDTWINKRQNGSSAQDGETVVIDNNATWHNYDNTIIVLINKNTKASAEYFLTELATVQNVIIVGTNSNGCMITDSDIDAEDIYLYNTGIPINFGPTLMLHDKMDGFDTKGWVPDIITRGDALETVIKLITGHRQV